MANPRGINQYTGKARAAASAKVQAVKSAAKSKAAAAVGRKPAAAKMPPPKPGTRVANMPPPKPGTRVAAPSKAAATKPAAKSKPAATSVAAKAKPAAKPAAKGPTPGSPAAVNKAKAELLRQKADALRAGTDAINAKTTGKKPKPKGWTAKKEDKVVVPASQAPGGKAITITKFIEMKHGTGSPQHLKALATYATGAKEMNATMRKLYGPASKPKPKKAAR